MRSWFCSRRKTRRIASFLNIGNRYPFEPSTDARSEHQYRASGLVLGYNAANGTYGDLVEQGVLDPAKVTRSALQNAASVASLILTTEAIVAEAPQDESSTKAAPAQGPGGIGGFGGQDY